jgi:Glycosyltransferase family 87
MRLCHGRVGTALAGLLFVTAVAVVPLRMGVLTRVGGIQLGAKYGMMDFYGNVYYPVRAFLDGEDPYDPKRFMALYPVDLPYPIHAPINLLLHLPFGLLPPGAAGITYFVFSALLALPLAYMSLRLTGIPHRGKIVLLASAILLSRPGHWNLVLGQRGIFLSLATYVALVYARDAPFLSGVGIAISMIKPTWGIPLAILMLASGYGRAVAAGLMFSAIANLPVLAVLVAKEGGVTSFVHVLLAGHRAWEALPEIGPATSYARLDAATTVSRFLGYPLSDLVQALLTAGILLTAALVLRIVTRDPESGSRDLTVGIICLGLILSGYHNGYDLVVLVGPFVALLAHGLPDRAGRRLRWVFLGLFVVPAINWIASDAVLHAWQPSHQVWVLVTSVNGVCVAVLFVGYLRLGMKGLRPSGAESATLLPSPSSGSGPTPPG